jgi:hypothetical protein
MLSELLALAEAGELPFSKKALAETLSRWEAAGKPLFRHSETYRAAYAPAYRVVMEESCS